MIRRAICLIGTKASTAAGDISSTVISSSTPQTGEIFRNTDGKMVRRLKRAIIKNAAALNETTPNEKACDVGEYILSTAANGTGRMPLPHSVNPREKLQITPCVTPQAAPQQRRNEITPLITTPVATLTPTNGCFTINVGLGLALNGVPNKKGCRLGGDGCWCRTVSSCVVYAFVNFVWSNDFHLLRLQQLTLQRLLPVVRNV